MVKHCSQRAPNAALPQNQVEWVSSPGLTPYDFAVQIMEERAQAIRARQAAECVWLLEHPPLYTAGTSAKEAELLEPLRLPVHRSGRGGRFTYHGPGQRVAYVMLDLQLRGRDVRAFVHGLEDWIIAALGMLGVQAKCLPDRIGVWVDTPAGEAKIAAIGVRIRRWVTLHGACINVSPDLEHYAGIVPCGLAGSALTSLAALGVAATMADLDRALMESFEGVFGAAAPTLTPLAAG